MKNITFTKNKISLDIRFSLEDNTIWMTQSEMATLFSTTIQNINKKLKKSTYNASTVNSRFTVALDGKMRKMSLYSLDTVRQIGFKINPILTQEFYDWCLKQLQILNSKNIPIQSNIIRFDNGIVQLDVTINPVEYTVYLTKDELLVLFDTSRQNLEHHISNIYDSCELEERATCKKYLQVQLEGNREVNREIVSYNLDMIISLGYRINTKRGIEFRRWATSTLKQYLLKGYIVDEKRTLVTNDNYLSLVNKVMNIDDRVKVLEGERNIVMPKDQLFIDNSLYDSKTYLIKLIMSANNNVTIVDPYADIILLSVISHKNKGCSITLITSKKNKIIDKELETFNQNYGGLKMYIDNSFHDRYLILDDTIYYHMGASINYFGAKITQLTKIEDTKIIDFLKNRLEIYKSGSATNI